MVIFPNEKTIGKWFSLWDPTLFQKGEVIRGGEWVTKIADDTKLFGILKPETDFGDLQNYLMVLGDKAINEKADKQ